MRGNFDSLHPIVCSMYFVIVILLSFALPHPFVLLAFYLGGMGYLCFTSGGKTILSVFLFSLVSMVAFTLITFLFSHFGVTVIHKLPNGNPLTLESLVYGGIIGITFAEVSVWLYIFGKTFDSEKIQYLFGRISKRIAIIFSIALRFLPIFRNKAKDISEAQDEKSRFKSMQMSALISWGFENSIETADAMKARGYELPRHSMYLKFSFGRESVVFATIKLCCAFLVVFSMNRNVFEFATNPKISCTEFKNMNIYYIAVVILAFLPALFNAISYLIRQIRVLRQGS